MTERRQSEIDVAYAARLARLEIDPSEFDTLRRDMEKIVDYVRLLSELNVDGVEPTAHAVFRTNVFREDVEGVPFDREAMLANAPATIDDALTRVPRVLPSETEEA